MGWVIAAIVIVFFVFLYGFRKLALGLVVAALIGGVLLYQHDQQQEQRASTRIPASEIVIEKIALKPTYRSSYDISGRIKNNSQTYRLDGISFKVTLRDCQGKDKSSCVMMGEATTYASITVPPEQARDFTASLYFGSDPMKPKGSFAWDYEITAVTAKRQ